MWQRGPMRHVVSATSEESVKVRRGLVVGRETVWTLKLECAHKTTRRGARRAPGRARCSQCPQP